MELRSRDRPALDLAPGHRVVLTPNLKFTGTVNVDETTHGFADKVFDRAQLIELPLPRDEIRAHLGGAPHAEVFMGVWDALRPVTPFGFRVLDEVSSYLVGASENGTDWRTALDEQLVQKTCPGCGRMRPPARRSTRSCRCSGPISRWPRRRPPRCAPTSRPMATSSSSEHIPSMDRLRQAVRGDGRHPGLLAVLPMLQTRHRRELRREERWSKEELVRHPEPRQLIRAMRKPGNLTERGLPIYTLDEHRYSTADIRENRLVLEAVNDTRAGLQAHADTGDTEAAALLRALDRALGQAPFLLEVGGVDPRQRAMTTTLLQVRLYRSVIALQAQDRAGSIRTEVAS